MSLARLPNIDTSWIHGIPELDVLRPLFDADRNALAWAGLTIKVDHDELSTLVLQ